MQQQQKRKPKLDRDTLLSPTGAAELLNRDRATLKRALRYVKPDGFEGDQPRFKLSTVLKAMEDHVRATGRLGQNAGGQPSRLHVDLDNLEQASQSVENFLRRLRSEPDLSRRRALAKSEGTVIGALEAAFEASIKAQALDATMVFSPFRDRVVGSAIGELLSLCEWKIAR